METIAIKVKKDASPAKRPLPGQLESQPVKAPKTILKKFWPLLICFLFLAEILFFVYKVYQPSSALNGLIPANAVSKSFFNPELLVETAFSLKDGNPISGYLDHAAQNQADLKRLASALKDEAAFVLLPVDPSQGDRPGWLLVAPAKSENDISKLIAQAEFGLKQRFNLVSDEYRQIKIIQIKPLDREQASVYLAQVGQYFCLASSVDLIKDVIDKNHI